MCLVSVLLKFKNKLILIIYIYIALALVLPFVGETLKIHSINLEKETPLDVATRVGRMLMILISSTRMKKLVKSDEQNKNVVDKPKGTLLVLENIDWFDYHSTLLTEYILNHLEVSKQVALCITVQPPSSDDANLVKNDRDVGERMAVSEKKKKKICFRIHFFFFFLSDLSYYCGESKTRQKQFKYSTSWVDVRR